MFRRSGIDHYWPVPHKDTSIQTTFKRKWMLQFHPLVIQRGNEKFQFFWEGLHGNTRRKMIFTYFYCLNVPLVGPAKFRESIFIRNQTAHDRCAMVTSSASRIRISKSSVLDGSSGRCGCLNGDLKSELKWPHFTWVSMVFHKCQV